MGRMECGHSNYSSYLVAAQVHMLGADTGDVADLRFHPPYYFEGSQDDGLWRAFVLNIRRRGGKSCFLYLRRLELIDRCMYVGLLGHGHRWYRSRAIDRRRHVMYSLLSVVKLVCGRSLVGLLATM
jgi:hypothetical protein